MVPYQIVPNAKSYAKSLTPEKITIKHLTARKHDVIRNIHSTIL